MTKEHFSLFVAGNSGSGKSFFVQYMVEKIYQDKAFTVVVDKKSEYQNLTQLGFKSAMFTSGLIQKLTSTKMVEILKANPRLLIKTIYVTPDEKILLLEHVAMAILYLGNALLVIDESWEVLPNQMNLDKQRYLYSISTDGRTAGVDSIFITQRIAMVSKICLSQSTHFAIFLLTERNDIFRANYLIGKTKEEIALLHPRTYYYHDTRNGKTELLTTQGLKLKTKHLG